MNDVNGLTVADMETAIRWLRWFGYAFIVAGSLFLLFLSAPQLIRHSSVDDLQPVACTIVASEVQATYVSSQKRSRRTYAPHITFEYAIDGQIFDSCVFRPFARTGGLKWAQKIVAAFPPGYNTLCYYNPDDPHYAVLDPSPDPMGRLLLLVPILFVLCGMLVVKLAGVVANRGRGGASLRRAG